MMPLAEIVHYTTTFRESYSLQDSFRIFLFPIFEYCAGLLFQTEKNSLAAELNVVKDGRFVFMVVEQRFAHFYHTVIFFKIMYSLQLVGKNLNIFA